MRDLYIALITFGLLPVVLMRPFVGVMLWTWLSLMAPHRLSWGFSYDFPYVQVIAVVSFLGLVLSRERKSFPITTPTVLFILFTLWVCVTTVFAISPGLAQARLVFVLKIFALSYFALLLVNTRERLHVLVWTIVLSIGFYGVKGGLFTILSGGGNRVYGPPGSFIEDNNHMALAMVMMVPLFRYLQLNSEVKLMRVGLGAAMGLSVVSALGSYSRGALLALSTTILMLLAKSRRRVLAGVLLLGAFGGAVAFLPEDWHERMSSIEEQGGERTDASVQGRFEIWMFSTQVALSRPIVGGGFDMLFDIKTYNMFNSDIKPRSAHSIIFQVLGEHGFVGLGLFLSIGLSLWFKGRWIRKAVVGRTDLQWAADLASMMQVSLVGYFVAGLFLNLGFFDLLYLYIPLFVGTAMVVQRELAAEKAVAERPGVASPTGPSERTAFGLSRS